MDGIQDFTERTSVSSSCGSPIPPGSNLGLLTITEEKQIGKSVRYYP